MASAPGAHGAQLSFAYKRVTRVAVGMPTQTHAALEHDIGAASDGRSRVASLGEESASQHCAVCIIRATITPESI